MLSQTNVKLLVELDDEFDVLHRGRIRDIYKCCRRPRFSSSGMMVMSEQQQQQQQQQAAAAAPIGAEDGGILKWRNIFKLDPDQI
jgi:hypothetical protein